MISYDDLTEKPNCQRVDSFEVLDFNDFPFVLNHLETVGGFRK